MSLCPDMIPAPQFRDMVVVLRAVLDPTTSAAPSGLPLAGYDMLTYAGEFGLWADEPQSLAKATPDLRALFAGLHPDHEVHRILNSWENWAEAQVELGHWDEDWRDQLAEEA